MEPIKFEGATMELGKPPGWSDEQCGSLPVQLGVDKYGYNTYISAWKLSPEEIQQLIENDGVFYIRIISPGHPPICPSLEKIELYKDYQEYEEAQINKEL